MLSYPEEGYCSITIRSECKELDWVPHFMFLVASLSGLVWALVTMFVGGKF